jgi:hypothetical protein
MELAIEDRRGFNGPHAAASTRIRADPHLQTRRPRMETLEYWKRVEDLALIAQDLIADRNIGQAVRMRRVCDKHLGEVVRALQERCELRGFPRGLVMRVIERVGNSTIDREHPLVVTGQGDYRRELYEVDVVRTEVRRGALRNRFVCAARRLLGVA